MGKLTGVTFGNGSGGACPPTAADGSQWVGAAYKYSYSSAGRTTGKRMSITRIGYQVGSSTFNLEGSWTYDNEGRPLTITYPVVTDPSTGDPTSTAFTYTYDSMGRPLTMGPGGPQGYIVNGVQYNAADQMTQISYYSPDGTGLSIGETRGYNSMFQLTSISAGWTSNYFPQSFSETYVYSGTQNNGQITSVVEGTGESVSYQYDKLKRLISASSTAGWSQSYTYDGFGNMTSRSPGFNIYADVTTNRMMGFTYDANGNLHSGNWNYDVENRLISVDASGGEQYMYDPSNKRIYKQNSGAPTYFYYGLDGKVVGEYTVDWSSRTLALDRVTESAYFGGKKVLPTVARDRLGSVRGNASAANKPYGENYTGANADGFATYYQDASTQLNYADQRYYSAGYGRFNTPDRYMALNGGANDPQDPQSWNRYPYVSGDPINAIDPGGMFECHLWDPFLGDSGPFPCDLAPVDQLPGFCSGGDLTELAGGCGGLGGGQATPQPSRPSPAKPCFDTEEMYTRGIYGVGGSLHTYIQITGPGQAVNPSLVTIEGLPGTTSDGSMLFGSVTGGNGASNNDPGKDTAVGKPQTIPCSVANSLEATANRFSPVLYNALAGTLLPTTMGPMTVPGYNSNSFMHWFLDKAGWLQYYANAPVVNSVGWNAYPILGN